MGGISRLIQDFPSKGKDNFESKEKVIVESAMVRASYLILSQKFSTVYDL